MIADANLFTRDDLVDLVKRRNNLEFTKVDIKSSKYVKIRV